MQTKWPYHDADEIAAAVEVLQSGKTNYWTGPHGQEFEKEFARATETQYAVAVSNGTTALECALHGLNLPAGAQVIVPCRTFMATASACVMNGLRPVLADIDPNTLNVTVDTLEARRTDRTCAVIVVHYAGLACNMHEIMDWARRHSIMVIEDCAHAHGAGLAYHDVQAGGVYLKPLGGIGHIGCYSFCVGKIMSTGGEGGMCVTNDPGLHARMASYRDHGRYQMVGAKDMTQFQWTVEHFGSNLRMTEVQAAIGRLQLKKLRGWVERRRMIAMRYDKAFGDLLGWKAYSSGHSFYMYLTRVYPNRRDKMLELLNARGIPARIGGCPNIGHEKAFGGIAEACPVADEVGARIMALPCYPTMSDDDVNKVIGGIHACLYTV